MEYAPWSCTIHCLWVWQVNLKDGVLNLTRNLEHCQRVPSVFIVSIGHSTLGLLKIIALNGHQLVYTTVRLLFNFVITSASGLLSIFRELVGWSYKWTSKIMWFKVGYLISSSFSFLRALVMDQNRFSDFCRTVWSWVYLKPYALVLSLKNKRTTQHWSMS